MRKIEMNHKYSRVYDNDLDIIVELTSILYDQQGHIIYESGIDADSDICIEHFHDYHENGKEKSFLITRNGCLTYKRVTSLDDQGRVSQRTISDSDESTIEAFSYHKCETGDLIIVKHTHTEYYDPDGYVNDVDDNISVSGFRKNGDHFNPDNYWYLS